MGAQAQARSLSYLVLAFGCAQIAWAAPRVPLELVLETVQSEEPLTTEKIWDLDPALLNPHLARWMVHRQARLHSAEVVELGPKKFAFKNQGVSARATLWVRGPGPWFSPISKFPCSHEVDDAFRRKKAQGLRLSGGPSLVAAFGDGLAGASDSPGKDFVV